MIVSFAWTTEAFLAGKKDVTRREWVDAHARLFQPGTIHQAYDKNPRAGGKQIGLIQVVSIRKEPLKRLLLEPDYAREELRREGGLWRSPEEFVWGIGWKAGRRYAGKPPDYHQHRAETLVWRVEFVKLEPGEVAA